MLATATLAIALLGATPAPQEAEPQGPKLEENASAPFGVFKSVRSRSKQARATKDRHEQSLWMSPARIVSPDNRTIGAVMHESGVDHIWINDQKVAGHERVYTLWVGNDAGTYAAIVHDGGADAVVVSGEKKDWLDRIDAIWLDDSGKHAAACGSKDGKSTVVVDGKPFELPGTLLEHTRPRKNAAARSTIENYVLPLFVAEHFQFSADGTRWVALVDCKTHVQPVIDGVPGPKYAAIYSATFSPDGKRIACIGTTKKGKSYAGSLWLDGKAKRIANGAKLFTFSPDGKRIAYHSAVPGKRQLAKKGKKPPLPRPGSRIVVDDYRSSAYDDATPIAFSPDSKRWAVAVRKGRKVSVIIDGEVQAAGTGPKDTRMFFLTTPRFSPDGTRVAYHRYKDKQATYHVDGLEGGLPHGWHEQTYDLQFSPDSQRVAVITKDGKENSVYVDGKLHRTVPVTRGGGAMGSRFRTPLFLSPDLRGRALSIGWTPDSKHLVEVRGVGAAWNILVGGSEVATKLVLFDPKMTATDKGALQFWGGNNDGGFVKLTVLAK